MHITGSADDPFDSLRRLYVHMYRYRYVHTVCSWVKRVPTQSSIPNVAGAWQLWVECKYHQPRRHLHRSWRGTMDSM